MQKFHLLSIINITALKLKFHNTKVEWKRTFAKFLKLVKLSLVFIKVFGSSLDSRALTLRTYFSAFESSFFTFSMLNFFSIVAWLRFILLNLGNVALFRLYLLLLSWFCKSSRLRKNDFTGKRRRIYNESYSDIHHFTRNCKKCCT